MMLELMKAFGMPPIKSELMRCFCSFMFLLNNRCCVHENLACAK